MEMGPSFNVNNRSFRNLVTNFTNHLAGIRLDAMYMNSLSDNDWNSSSGNETLDELNFRYAQSLLPFAIILGLFCFMGIVGNAIVIMVFTYSKEYSNTNFKIFVLCLAVLDLLSCVTLMPVEIIKTRHFFSISDHTPCKVKCFCNIFAMNTSAFFLLVVCIERFRKVCQPLKKQLRPTVLIKTLTLAFMVSLLLSIPAPIMCGVTDHLKSNVNGHNVTVYVCSAEKKYHKSIFRYIYKFGLSVLLVIIGIALIIMYCMIMKAVIKHLGNRKTGEIFRFVQTRSKGQTADRFGVACLTDYDHLYMKVKPIEGQSNVNTPNENFGGSNVYKTYNDEQKQQNSSSDSFSTMKSRWSVVRSGSYISLRNNFIYRRFLTASSRRIPYKTLIWFILTLIFLLTFFINAGLSFMSTEEYLLSPTSLFWFQLFFRIYFINNIINPVIYALLDKRFKRSLHNMMSAVKRKCSSRCSFKS